MSAEPVLSKDVEQIHLMQQSIAEIIFLLFLLRWNTIPQSCGLTFVFTVQDLDFLEVQWLDSVDTKASEISCFDHVGQSYPNYAVDKNLGELIQFVNSGEIHYSCTADAKGLLTLGKLTFTVVAECIYTRRIKLIIANLTLKFKAAV